MRDYILIAGQSLQLFGITRVEYRKNFNNWTVCYEVQNSLLWKGGKNTAKTRPLSPLRDRKKNKNFLTLLGEESPTT